MFYDEEEAERQHRLKEATQKRFAQEALQRRLEEEGRDAVPLLEEEKEIATRLHDVLCHWNHTDQCGWFYFDDTDHQWNREYTHVKYIKMARQMILQGDDPGNIIGVLMRVEAAKKIQ